MICTTTSINFVINCCWLSRAISSHNFSFCIICEFLFDFEVALTLDCSLLFAIIQFDFHCSFSVIGDCQNACRVRLCVLCTELEISKSALVQKQSELQDKSKVLDRDRQEKDNFQAQFFESIPVAHLESLKNLNKNLQRKKLETEALSVELQSELKLSLS